MKKKLIFVFVLMVLVKVYFAYPSGKEVSFKHLKGPYMGMKAPGEKAVVFLDGLISNRTTPGLGRHTAPCSGTLTGKRLGWTKHSKQV